MNISGIVYWQQLRMPSFYSRRLLPWLLNRTMGKEGFQKLRRPTLLEAKGKILEIGFGSGINMGEYPNTVREITAIDPSSGLYELAKERIERSGMHVQFVLGSAEQLPFEANTFDTVVSTWSLCSIPNVDRALDEIFRVLKPGGVFLFVEHGLSPRSLLQKLQHTLTPLWIKMSGGCHLNREIGSLIERHGFETVYQDFPFEGFSKLIVHMYQGKAMKPVGIV